MKYFLLLSLLSSFTFAQAPKPPLEELFKDVPLVERQNKRIELAMRMISANNDTGYNPEMTVVLYALNLKENPKHGLSWFYIINKLFQWGRVQPFEFTPEITAKADQMINEGLKLIPDYQPLLMRRAYLDMAMKKDKEMIRQNALRINENSPDMNLHVLAGLGELLSILKEKDRAANVYRLMDSKATNQEEKELALECRGLGAQLAEDYPVCVEAFTKLRATRKIYGREVGLVYCLNYLRRFDEALAIGNEYKDSFGQGGAMDCNVSYSNEGKGFSLYEAGNYAAAESYMIESLKSCPDASRYNKLVYNYIKLNNLERAKETILAAVKVIPENRRQYLVQWSNYFKDNNTYRLFFLDESFKQISNPAERVDSYLGFMFKMGNEKDPNFTEYSRKTMSLASELYEANRNDYSFVKSYGLMNAMFGINRDSLIYLTKAKEILAHAKSLKPEQDHNIEQTLARIAQVEAGIRAGTIKPSEP